MLRLPAMTRCVRGAMRRDSRGRKGRERVVARDTPACVYLPGQVHCVHHHAHALHTCTSPPRTLCAWPPLSQGNGRARRGAKGGARRGKAAKPSPTTTGRGRKRRADAPAEATETNNTSKEQQVSTGGRVAGAAAAAPTRASNAPPCAATTTTDSDEDEGDTLTEAPLLSSQDNKLSRCAARQPAASDDR